MARHETPTVSIIVPFYNAQAFLKSCLECLQNQSYDSKQIQLIAVDNASSDNSAEICRSFASVTYLYYDERRGPAAARNAGISLATGEYILFVDADCLAGPKLVEEHVRAHLEFKQSDPDIKLIGGGVGGKNTNFWSICDDLCSWYPFHPKLSPRIEKTLLPSGNMSIERTLLAELGGFNTSLRYGEDAYICHQVTERGFKLYFLPSATVFHVNRTTFKGFMQRAKDYADVQFAFTSLTNIIKKDSNILISISKQCCYFMYKYVEMTALILRTQRLMFFPALPFIILNRCYFGFYRIRNQILH